MRPMLATPGALPIGPDWRYEVKWDGVRALVSTASGRVRVVGRSGRDQTDCFPELLRLADAAPPDHLLDGEIVVLQAGVPSFHALAPRLHATARTASSLARSTPATLLVFDLLVAAGTELTPLPYDERRARLADLLPDGPAWQVPGSFDDGEALWQATLDRGLEGVVAKRATSPYRPGRRHPDWVKVAHRRTRSFVVGGFRPGASPGTGRFGSLLVGTPVGDDLLRFDGAVGSGVSAAEQRALRTVMDDVRRRDPPFDDRSALPADGVWCDPVLVVDVAHLGRSGQGLLRQPAMVRVRPDRGYDDVLAEGG